MRAFQADSLGPVEGYRLVERARPEPGPGEIRIRVRATGLGYADGLLAQGLYQVKPPLPYVPGGEIAGTVDAVGAGVTALKPGDAVITELMGGGLADHAIAPADEVDLLPPGLPFASAAALLVDYQTAHYALMRGAVKAGETVLVTGASGGVGMAGVQLARLLGARVIASASTAEKRERALALGAHAAIDASSADIRAEIRAVAPGGMVDVVFDPVGGPHFEALFRSLAKEGRHLVLGFAGGPIPALPINLPLLKSASLVGVDIRHFRAAYPEEARQARRAIFRQAAEGLVKPPPIMPFALEEAAAALAAVTGRAKTGKIVVVQDEA